MKKKIYKVVCLTVSIGILLSHTYESKAVTIDDAIQVGDNIYASLNDNGRVVLSGNGDMWDNMHNIQTEYKGYGLVQGEEYCPWFGKWENEINSMEFGEGITSVGENACGVCYKIDKKNKAGIIWHGSPGGLRYLTDVKFSSTVNRIGVGAFYSTLSLHNITIPGTVKKIESYAFYKSALKKMKLGNGIETLGERAFAETDIESIDIPGTVNEIGKMAFYNNKLREVTINDGVEKIKSLAFYGDLKVKIYSKDVIIEDNAIKMDGYNNVIMCYKGSSAERYAINNGINVKYFSEKNENESTTKKDNTKEQKKNTKKKKYTGSVKLSNKEKNEFQKVINKTAKKKIAKTYEQQFDNKYTAYSRYAIVRVVDKNVLILEGDFLGGGSGNEYLLYYMKDGRNIV